jgi:hypothetical protein
MKCALCGLLITAFPKAESDQPEWQDAIEALLVGGLVIASFSTAIVAANYIGPRRRAVAPLVAPRVYLSMPSVISIAKAIGTPTSRPNIP